jgi:hypothetical protein
MTDLGSRSTLSPGRRCDQVEKGIAEMSKVYDETGRELYMGQGDREHD